MDKHSVLKTALPDEVKRMVLCEALIRYRNELMDDQERALLEDRIQRLRRQLGLVGVL